MEPIKLMQHVPTEDEVVQRAKWYHDIAKQAMHDEDNTIELTRALKRMGAADYHELDLSRNTDLVSKSTALSSLKQYLERATLHDVGRTTKKTARHQAYNFLDYMPLDFSEKF